MADWDGRNTTWRQGHALSGESSVALGLVQSGATESKLAIVVSHDCDLPQMPGDEPRVEVIVAERLAKEDGNCTNGKNSRLLHLPFEISGVTTWFALSAPTKTSVSKDALAGHIAEPNAVLEQKNRAILRRWLGARYNRSAFPNEFEKRLRDTKLGDRISDIMKPSSSHIIAVYFDLDQGEEFERSGEANVYDLAIFLVYVTEEDEPAARTVAENAAERIHEAFRKKCCDAEGEWRWIKLAGCYALADTAMTFRESQLLSPANLDHLSFRGNGEPDPMPA
jgi:hypothetical protein